MPPAPLALARATPRPLELDASTGAVPEWIPLMDAGELVARDGRRWTLSDPAAVVAVSFARAGSTDPVVDYEHQTDHAPQNGQPAPAAGWVRDLAARDGGIWARVEWTARAKEHIAAREYRYYSPTFAHERAASREVRAIHRVALTNAPAFDVPALAKDTGDAMTPEQAAALAKALGLARDAAPDDVLAAAYGLAAAAAALGPVAEALGLARDAAPDDVLAAAKARTAPDPGAVVPRAEFDRVAAQLTALQQERTEERAAAAVDEATAAGKVAPAQREWALGYARADAAGFAAFVAAAPAILAAGPIGGRPAAPDPKAPLDETEVAACRMLGISHEDFQASRAEIAGRDAR